MLATGTRAWIPIELMPPDLHPGDECHMMSSVVTHLTASGNDVHYYYRVRITGLVPEAAECEVLETLSPEAAEAAIGQGAIRCRGSGDSLDAGERPWT
ncbi:hypothetical protein M1D97_04445 [Kushneria sp. AK178]